MKVLRVVTGIVFLFSIFSLLSCSLEKTGERKEEEATPDEPGEVASLTPVEVPPSELSDPAMDSIPEEIKDESNSVDEEFQKERDELQKKESELKEKENKLKKEKLEFTKEKKLKTPELEEADNGFALMRKGHEVVKVEDKDKGVCRIWLTTHALLNTWTKVVTGDDEDFVADPLTWSWFFTAAIEEWKRRNPSKEIKHINYLTTIFMDEWNFTPTTICIILYE